MALGQTAGCPRVNRAKKFMCSPRNTGKINFSLWLTGGLSRLSKSLCQTPPSYGFGRYGFGFFGPRIAFRATGALWGRATPFFYHFSVHLSSVLGWTELCHEVWTPGPQKPQIISNENHHLALLDYVFKVYVPFSCPKEFLPSSILLTSFIGILVDLHEQMVFASLAVFGALCRKEQVGGTQSGLLPKCSCFHPSVFYVSWLFSPKWMTIPSKLFAVSCKFQVPSVPKRLHYSTVFLDLVA